MLVHVDSGKRNTQIKKGSAWKQLLIKRERMVPLELTRAATQHFLEDGVPPLLPLPVTLGHMHCHHLESTAEPCLIQ